MDAASVDISTLALEEKGAAGSGICAICLEKVDLQETALVKGCEHAYCVMCILRWASYSSKQPTCPQCKLPFEFLVVHRTLDGSIKDYMFDESVCLLLRAQWFVPLSVPDNALLTNDDDLRLYQYDVDLDEDYDDHDDEDDTEDYYVSSRTSSILIRNRRWGENGYIRGGRKQARPVNHLPLSGVLAGSSSSSSTVAHKGKATVIAASVGSKSAAIEGKSKVEMMTEGVVRDAGTEGEGSKHSVGAVAAGRRAKRAMKREAADKVAAAKHKQRLEKLGRA